MQPITDPLTQALALCQQFSRKILSFSQPTYKIKVTTPNQENTFGFSTPNKNFDHLDTTTSDCQSNISVNKCPLIKQPLFQNQLWKDQLRFRLAVNDLDIRKLLVGYVDIHEKELITLLQNRLGYRSQYIIRKTARKIFEDCQYDEDGVRAVDDVLLRWKSELEPPLFNEQKALKFLQQIKDNIAQKLSQTRGSISYDVLNNAFLSQGYGFYQYEQLFCLLLERHPETSLNSLNLSILGIPHSSGQENALPPNTNTVSFQECQVQIIETNE